MKCPRCDVELHIADRQGIEIDYCPKCRGVWLDRGELDKIIEKSTWSDRYDDERYRYYDEDDYRDKDRDEYRYRKKRSFWGELFDFD